MLRPVGPERPAVYWRRRLVLLAFVVLVLVLLITVVRALASRSEAAPAAAPASSTSSSAPVTASRPAPRTSPTPTPTTSAPHLPEFAKTSATSSGSPAASSGSPASGVASASASSSPPPKPCTARDLRIAARPQADHFAVGSKPTLGLQVTDVAAAPCVQDLADKQVLLRLYNGEARVWGSHDCGVQPGTDLRTLLPGRPVRVAMQWSGLTSAPGCAGARQPVGAGSYTLYASVSGHDGTAATFTLS